MKIICEGFTQGSPPFSLDELVMREVIVDEQESGVVENMSDSIYRLSRVLAMLINELGHTLTNEQLNRILSSEQIVRRID